MTDLPAASRPASGDVRDIRRRFLMTVMKAALLWGGLIAVPSALGWVPLGPVQSLYNIAFFAINCALLVILRLRPALFPVVAVAFFVSAFLYATAAQFLVADDQLRMLLFFPLVGAVFLILGTRAGWVTIGATLGVFVAAYWIGVFDVTPLAVSTYVLTLCMTGTFFHAFGAQTISAVNTIEEQNSVLDAAARKDSLTGVFNRRAFREKIEERVHEEGAGAGFSIAYMDIDRFKEINDLHGHAIGDTVLVAVAEVLQSRLRAHDVVARIGGEEFAILLPRTDLAAAVTIAERIRSAIGSMRAVSLGVSFTVTVSIGVASSESGFASVDALLQAADAAMYAAKRDGRDRVVAWTELSSRAAVAGTSRAT